MDLKPGSLGWSLLKNTGAQVIGRVITTGARLASAAIIVRAQGQERFGEYSLVLGLLLVAEWLTEFGLNEIVVREIGRTPDRRAALLRSLLATRILHAAGAYALLVGTLWILGYGLPIVAGAAVCGAELFFYAGILVYRALFRATLTMERETVADVGGAILMLPLLWLAAELDAGLPWLLACYLASRAVFFGMSWAFGRTWFPLRAARADLAGTKALWFAALPIGISGLLVASNDALDYVMLSKLSGVDDVAIYAGAVRYVSLAIIVAQSLAWAIFPVLSRTLESQRKDEFHRIFQLGVDLVLVAAFGLLCTLMAGADFLMALVGEELRHGAPALRILAGAFVIRALLSVLAAALIATGGQRHAAWMTSLSLITKAVIFAGVLPGYGWLGAAWVILGVEFFCGLIPNVLVTQSCAGWRIRWGTGLRAGVAAGLCLLAIRLLGCDGTLTGALAAMVLFPALCFTTGAVTTAQIRALREAVRNRQGPAARL